eukprot:CAMPEP_0181173260 /NCGR_PEP_ID=MMETSP1096-20121128/2903_1 /TAXON_ID=156174 ORGANISM="Chrysochromulina ericina, Strain CCMP281" /NCGR_SAMPLE_ID=MMETSP1096 /ASSEMBLY_ACC=CAM_ASM_000453 /LENGTH=86 /DNA_ID=CAMNT_0023261073 /DNA_START=281 /DNA_END=538 /DNA_ORIENTATION=+
MQHGCGERLGCKTVASCKAEEVMPLARDAVRLCKHDERVSSLVREPGTPPPAKGLHQRKQRTPRRLAAEEDDVTGEHNVRGAEVGW